MPKIISITVYECTVCKKAYDKKREAESCEKDHDIIYLEISRDNLRRLKNVLLSCDSPLITPELYGLISKASTLRGDSL